MICLKRKIFLVFEYILQEKKKNSTIYHNFKGTVTVWNIDINSFKIYTFTNYIISFDNHIKELYQ